MPSFTTAAVLSAIAAIPAVSAHGYVANVRTGGQVYAGASPNWKYQNEAPDQAGWMALNQDNGFVDGTGYDSVDIACHKSAKPGNQYIPIKAGDDVDFMWNTWPESHHGPITAYMARCNGDCTQKQDASTLHWFKVEEAGLLDGSSVPGYWASDKLIENNNTWTTTIPADIAPGNFVLRHEIIGLHSAGQENGAQNYPMCFNVKITGEGSRWPCNEGAPCAFYGGLYSPDDAGIKISIYSQLSNYVIPGPKLWNVFSSAGSKVKRVAQSFVA